MSFADDAVDGEEDVATDEQGIGSYSNITYQSLPKLYDTVPAKKPKFGKNPSVDTSFLPDRDREEQERREREELRKEWLRKQEEFKNEDIEITYSFWDGSGHRKSIVVSWS